MAAEDAADAMHIAAEVGAIPHDRDETASLMRGQHAHCDTSNGNIVVAHSNILTSAAGAGRRASG